MERHLRALTRRHRALEVTIAELTRRPGGWSPAVPRLKRMRLAVKDQIEAYRQRSGRQHAGS
jgi:hypothetical protein